MLFLPVVTSFVASGCASVPDTSGVEDDDVDIQHRIVAVVAAVVNDCDDEIETTGGDNDSSVVTVVQVCEHGSTKEETGSIIVIKISKNMLDIERSSNARPPDLL